MDWLRQNGFWLLILVIVVGVHLFGHGGHGGGDESKQSPERDKGENRRPTGHQH